jgi:hypothetical protein
MEIAYTEDLGPVINGIWRGETTPVTGPGTYVFFITCDLDDTSTMQVQVIANPGGDYALVEDYTSMPADLSSAAMSAGFQSAPVPLVDNTWTASVRVMHDDATLDHTFVLKVVKL